MRFRDNYLRERLRGTSGGLRSGVCPPPKYHAHASLLCYRQHTVFLPIRKKLSDVFLLEKVFQGSGNDASPNFLVTLGSLVGSSL
jgi:hypothetical protein